MSAKPPVVNPMIGKIILDRYEIIAQLGAGGMGAVYKARQISMDRMVALKLIHPAIAGNEQVAARFHREMQAMTRVGHPNTVQVYDYGRTEDGQLFLAMELLGGKTLSAVLVEGGAVPLPRLCHITAQVLRALGAVHEEGIVHRDLKPDNVMLLDRYGEHDFVKVLDLGIARFVGDTDGDGPPTQMTAAGALLGTPAYMSPEQALGQPVGPATDFYALGIMLYQMATGSLPFTGQTLPQLILSHAREAPRPPSEVAAVDPRLEALILELLLKEPERRPQPAAAVLARIEALAGPGEALVPGEGRPRPPEGGALTPPAQPGDLQWTASQPPPARRTPVLVGVGVGALLVIAGGALALRMLPSADPAARARLTALLTADGDPAPPAPCQVKDKVTLAALLRPAELLAGGADAAAAQQALGLLEGPLPAHAQGAAEASALVARARLRAQGGGETSTVGAQAERAAEAARKVVERCPSWALGHNLLGNAHQMARQPAEAETAYRAALAAAPEYAAPRYNLGLLALRRKDPQAAILAFDEVLKRSPDHPLAHMVRGQARLLLGDPTRALEDLAEATRRQPDRAEVWLLLGQARAKAGQVAGAKEAFCKAKALGNADGARLCP